MTVTTTGPSADRVTAPRPASAAPRWTVTGRLSAVGVRAGQVVAAQVAVALPVAALGRGAGSTAVAVVGAVLLLTGAWIRVRGRWLFEWLGVAWGHLARRRAAGSGGLLDRVAPGATIQAAEPAGHPGAVVDDPTGLAVLLELGDPGDLLGRGRQQVPSPSELLPPPTAPGPPVRVQLLLGGAPAPAVGTGAGAAATSYRQLTDGRLPAWGRAVLVVRVLRTDGFSDEELRRRLAGLVRRTVRRLGPVSARPLGEHAALRVLAEYAHHDADPPVQETWKSVRTGPLSQATFRLRRWPTDCRGLIPRLLALPAASTTVSLSAGPSTGTDPPAVQLTVRLAGWNPAELAGAGQALHRLVTGTGGEVSRLDGEHLPGLAATLPLALPTAYPSTGGPEPADLEPALDEAGLMVGANRHGGALTVRLFRPEPTRIVLVGGVRAAQLLLLRAMAAGARVAVQTARPRSWEPFARGVGTPGAAIPLLPPGRQVAGDPATALRPLLVVVDAGRMPAAFGPGTPWQTVLVVRDELTPTDVDLLGRADLAVLQPLTADEAALAGTALGLGGSAGWLTRIRADMVAVVNRRALRWALLSPTPIESQLIGRPTRR
ncbi:type VII secretion protein EccE [Micromonospora sp. SH-82]|uniref:type VII secretion protein EccE n=1 Tax=Micromonospora sp. SH-82 TaxID=3132938 RepID=UPI003EBF7D7D